MALGSCLELTKHMRVDVILIVFVSPRTRSNAEDLFKITIEAEVDRYLGHSWVMYRCVRLSAALVTHGNVFRF